MRIQKVINNNIISAYNEQGLEIIAMGRGLGFGKRPGDVIEEAKIEKVFKIDENDLFTKLQDLLRGIEWEHLQVSDDIIRYAQKRLKPKLSQSIYLTLTDHISFAVKRVKNRLTAHNDLLLEIQRFYPTEYAIGQYGLNLMREVLQLPFEEDEAGFIALHLINAEYGGDSDRMIHFPNLVRDIVDIVRSEMQVELDTTSLHYERFVTHIKFLLQRVYRKDRLEEPDHFLDRMLQAKYPREYRCGVRIAQYIEKETKQTLGEAEHTYLAIHIRRVTMQEA